MTPTELTAACVEWCREHSAKIDFVSIDKMNFVKIFWEGGGRLTSQSWYRRADETGLCSVGKTFETAVELARIAQDAADALDDREGKLGKIVP